MSNDTYNELWKDVQDRLEQLLVSEEIIWSRKAETSQEDAYEMLGKLYLKYMRALKDIDLTYDQVVHPQKRMLVRRVLDAVIARMLQLKQQMVLMDLADVNFIDNPMLDEKMTPLNTEIPIPRYFAQDRRTFLEKKATQYSDIKFALGEEEPEAKVMTIEEAIKLLQTNERARQGRLRYRLMLTLRKKEIRSRQKKVSIPRFTPEEAATKIQSWIRRFVTMRRVKRMKDEEDMFLGMIAPPPDNSLKEKLTAIEESRRKTQIKYEEEYQNALIEVREYLVVTEGPTMKETMQDDIRDWFITTREQTGNFPEYPSDDEGGSALIFNPPPIDEEPVVDKKGKKGEKDKKEEKGKKDAKKNKKDDNEVAVEPSLFTEVFKEMCEEYRAVWKYLDESDNPEQSHVVEMVKALKRPEVESEMRQVVDALMRVELEQLKQALDRDKKKKSKKKKKKKKKGKGKGKKGRKEKDLTPDRTLDSLYEELVIEGIIKKYPKVDISEFLGEASYSGVLERAENKNPLPCLGDIRRVVSEYCILGVGSAYAHASLPVLKSVLLAGPSGTGKHLLLNAICTHLGAVLFDLSASNLEGKYPGKPGLQMLMHLVSKVGRLMQPSVILLDEAHRTFQKRVPKTDKSEPKRIKKDLIKLMKGVGPLDQLIMVGLSSKPWEGEAKGMSQAFNRMLLIPPPDHAARLLLWKSAMYKHLPTTSPHFDFSLLTKLSDKYTVGNILQVIKDVFTKRRMLQLKYKPIQISEFVDALAKYLPMFKEEEDQYKKWFDKTPMGKKRNKMLTEKEPDAGKGKGKDKKK